MVGRKGSVAGWRRTEDVDYTTTKHVEKADADHVHEPDAGGSGLEGGSA